MDPKLIEVLRKASVLPADGDINEAEVSEALQAAGYIIPAAVERPPANGLAAARGLGLIEPPDWFLKRERYSLEGRACRSIDLKSFICDPGEEGTPNNEVPAGSRILASRAVNTVWLESTLTCSTFGAELEESFWKNAVTEDLDLCGWSYLARELWTGEKATANGQTNRFLASVDAIDVMTGEAVSEADPYLDENDDPVADSHAVASTSIVNAVGALEDALSKCTCGGVHIIHTSPRNVAVMSDHGLIDRMGGRIFTKRGTLVIDDNGYPGTGPEGTPPVTATTNYIYATSVLTGRLGGTAETVYPQSGAQQNWILAKSNDIVYQGQRPGAISWLCCHFVARVETP